MKCFTLLIITIFITTSGMSQERKDSLNPYELLTKYYEEGFKPFAKGNYYSGIAFSLTNSNLENSSKGFDKVIAGIDKTTSITFKGGYFLKDYIMTGMNFELGRDEFGGNIDVSGDTVSRQTMRKYLSFSPVIKSYVPLTKNNRLSFFTEIGLGAKFANSLSEDISNVDVYTRKYGKDFTFSAGLGAGVTFFALENIAIEVMLKNLVGYELKISKQRQNNVDYSKKTTHNVNFDINLLSLKVGVAYFIQPKKK